MSCNRYKRPCSKTVLTKPEKDALIAEYLAWYREIASVNPDQLNLKLSRKVFDEILNDELGVLLLQRSAELATNPGPVQTFLRQNPPPNSLERLLPDEFRAFCLLMNAVKQWVSAEQAAADRYLLGGRAKEMLRSAADVCTISGQPIAPSNMQFHHPLRDGRPPIPVSEEEHRKLEKQSPGRGSRRLRRAPGSSLSDVKQPDASSPEERLGALRRRGNRSWIMLYRGALDLLGHPVKHSTLNVRASSRSFARKALEVTGKDLEWILAFLDENGHVSQHERRHIKAPKRNEGYAPEYIYGGFEIDEKPPEEFATRIQEEIKPVGGHVIASGWQGPPVLGQSRVVVAFPDRDNLEAYIRTYYAEGGLEAEDIEREVALIEAI